MKEAPIRHRLEFGLYRLVRGLLRLLPHPAARPLGARLGDLAWWLLSSRRKVALKNLAIAFPDAAPAERRRMALGSFRHLGAALCDTLSASRFDLVGLCRRVSFEGWEHLVEAQRRAGGMFVLSAHLGTWEIAAHVAGAWAGPLHVVGRPLDNPHLDRELEKVRQRFGNVMIAKRGAARGMLRALEKKALVGILIDQRVKPKEGIRVPFFGRESFTSPILARMAIRTGRPVVPIFCFPEPGGRYRFVARPAIEPAGPEESEQAIAALTCRYLEATEAEIRRHPEQWMWMHDRFKD
ncbi:MAG TPA: lysophospholipid acyltransferase family protein [Thermoanaerobaculia bacterium]|nr:lysophospholipid acyltransferase family protein [Thermoanaerobaculia bacterium]